MNEGRSTKYAGPGAFRMIPGLVGHSPIEFVVVFKPETPDRTAAITRGAESPLPFLCDSARRLQDMGASHVVYACNTAHYFVPDVIRGCSERPVLRVPIIDVIDAAVEVAAGAGIRSVGLLATTGTLAAALYQEALRKKQIEVFLPSAGEQEDLVMEAIYGEHGIKAGMTTGIARQLAREAARRLVERGAEGIILGCTELPLVMKGVRVRHGQRPIVLIDPARAVAGRLQRMGGSHGIAGGLGPEATIAFLEAMDAPEDFIDLQRDIIRATREELGAERDQDHLEMLGIASPDPVDAARRVARAGAGFLVMARSAAWARDDAAAATGMPVLIHAGRHFGRDVVRRVREGDTIEPTGSETARVVVAGGDDRDVLDGSRRAGATAWRPNATRRRPAHAADHEGGAETARRERQTRALVREPRGGRTAEHDDRVGRAGREQS